VACAAHVVLRWDVEVWYVLAPQSEHVRTAVLESAEIFLPAPHVGCVSHVKPLLVPEHEPLRYWLVPHDWLLHSVHVLPLR
jgi:hypothetical protein